MAVDLMGCYAPYRADDQLAIQEAATAGLRSLELLVLSLSAAAPSKAHQQQQPFGEIADQAVSKFCKVISILDRTGHVRVRHGPVESPPPAAHVTVGGEGSMSKGRSLRSAGKPPLSGHKRKPCPGGHSEANTTGNLFRMGQPIRNRFPVVLASECPPARSPYSHKAE